MSKTKILKLVMFVVALVICIGATIYLLPVMRNLSTVEGQVAFKQKVENSGVLGLISLFALEVAQIFLFLIPGEPIEILAGMCYGALWGTVFIMASAGIISTVIFFLVRKLGKKFVYKFCDENKVKKIENSKLFQNPIFIAWNAKRFISIHCRTVTNKANKVYSNIHTCKVSISNIINISWCEYCSG